MLPINSENNVLPGGPVSDATKPKQIVGGAKTINRANARSASARWATAGSQLLAPVESTARKILQHGCASESFCLAGFGECEWKGHSLGGG
jgi:hypothetical protein